MQKIKKLIESLARILVYISSFIPVNSVKILLLKAMGASVGNGCSIAHGLDVTSPWRLQIGNDCFIASDVILAARGGITIGDSVTISSRAQVITDSHNIDSPVFAHTRRPISIGSNSWIASGAIIAGNATVSEGTVIGAGAVLTKHSDPWSLYVGNPAKKVRERKSQTPYRLSASKARHYGW